MEPEEFAGVLSEAILRLAIAHERLADVSDQQLIVSREAVNVQRKLAANAASMEKLLDESRRSA